MEILTETAEAELLVKSSRFLAEIFPVNTQAEARQKLKEQKKTYSDATHVVYAFICGFSAEIMGSSDDGEPSGTAGRPVLDVLKGRKCTNVLLTVTRWFGGTLLGTGGLVKAYSESAKAVIAEADKNNSFEIYTPKSSFSFETPYALYDKIKHQFKNYKISEVNEEYGSSIAIKGKIISSEENDFSKFITEISMGQIKPVIT